jgi:hypothetical protein
MPLFPGKGGSAAVDGSDSVAGRRLPSLALAFGETLREAEAGAAVASARVAARQP